MPLQAVKSYSVDHARFQTTLISPVHESVDKVVYRSVTDDSVKYII